MGIDQGAGRLELVPRSPFSGNNRVAEDTEASQRTPVLNRNSFTWRRRCLPLSQEQRRWQTRLSAPPRTSALIGVHPRFPLFKPESRRGCRGSQRMSVMNRNPSKQHKCCLLLRERTRPRANQCVTQPSIRVHRRLSAVRSRSLETRRHLAAVLREVWESTRIFRLLCQTELFKFSSSGSSNKPSVRGPAASRAKEHGHTRSHAFRRTAGPLRRKGANRQIGKY